MLLRKLIQPHADGCGQLVLHHLELSIAQFWPLGSLTAKEKRESFRWEQVLGGTISSDVSNSLC